MQIKRTVRIDETVLKDLSSIAAEEHQSENMMIETALKFYRDYYFMKGKATFINDDILNTMKATVNLLQQSLNSKTNRVLSELAIQSCIANQILAGELDVDSLALRTYRGKAIEFLNANNRVLRLDELVD